MLVAVSYDSSVLIVHSNLVNNSATISGGALRVIAGTVNLLNKTILSANSAPSGSSALVNGRGSVTYTLPAPSGRWVLTPDGLTYRLERGSIETDFPFTCNAGLVGGPSAVDQSSPACGGPW